MKASYSPMAVLFTPVQTEAHSSAHTLHSNLGTLSRWNMNCLFNSINPQ